MAMKPKPKPLQYSNRARRIPRKIVKLELELKALDLAVKTDNQIQENFDKFIERSKQRIRNRINELRDRHQELERLGYASLTLFLLSLV